ncbi:MAG: AMP-binding protein, partial [bacterium]|nr:AMP-binding protein [bacterium]
YTGQQDLIVGSPIAGRQRLEVEGLIGFFLNTLALRTRIEAECSFRELLERVRKVVLDATAYQEVPFEKLLEELQPERDLSRSPLFQVFFNMTNLPDQGTEIPELELESVPLPEVESKFDLTLYAREAGAEIHVDLVYNADLFTPERMAEMLEQYAGLLHRAVADPEAAIGGYSLLTPGAEKLLPRPAEPLRATWEGTIHWGFAGRAERFPEHPAVVDPHQRWSYRELDERSNQLARHLLAHGVAHAPVAIWAHRSASLVWALLGVLKAGAAFVILDPAYPSARLVRVLQQARPRGWLEIAGAGAPPAEVRSLVAELGCCRLTLPGRSAAADEDLLAAQPVTDPAVPLCPDDLAYLAFTSGSTGEPKGIAGTHAPVGHFLDWHVATFGLSPSDRFSMLSGLSHDPLLRDVFAPLWLGATLVVPDPEEIGTPGWLAQWLRREQITVVHLTPAMGQLLVTGEARETLPALRYLFFGGEPLTRPLLTRLRALAPEASCVNFYGTTETPQAMGYFIVPEKDDLRDVLPLGRGIAGVQLLVLNPAGTLAGIGERGEIGVRTPYLARGYLGDPELTRERFVPDP